MKKCLVVLSGGMDSTTLLELAHQERGPGKVGAVSFDYGQRHKKELQFAKQYCKSLGVPHSTISLEALNETLSNSALTGDIEVPEGHFEDDNMKVTVVPNRNMILMAVAAGKAVNDGYQIIAYAAHAGDHAIYPDCRTEFADAMSEALKLCHYDDGIELWRPFMDLRKEDIAELGSNLGVDYRMTWSCYKGGEKHCGRCATCVERKEAFTLAGIEDSTEYE